MKFAQGSSFRINDELIKRERKLFKKKKQCLKKKKMDNFPYHRIIMDLVFGYRDYSQNITLSSKFEETNSFQMSKKYKSASLSPQRCMVLKVWVNRIGHVTARHWDLFAPPLT